MDTTNDNVISRVKNVFNNLNKNSKNATELSRKSFNTEHVVKYNDLVSVGNNVNAIVGYTKPNERNSVSNIGCMAGGNLDEFKVDLSDELTQDNVFDYCKKSAQLSNQPFFSVGANKDSDGYACYVGDENLLDKYTENGPARVIQEIATYNTEMMRRNMGLGEGDRIINNGGYLKVEDGNLKIYNSSGTLIVYHNSEEASAVNLYDIADDVVIQGVGIPASDQDFLDTVISCSNSSYMMTTFGNILNNYKNSHIPQSDLDSNKTHKDIETICNDLDNCSGYQYIKDSTGQISWILFNDNYEKLSKVQNASRANANIQNAGMYLKPKEFVKSRVVIKNYGKVFLKIGGTEGVVVMSAGKIKGRNYIKN